MATPMIRAKQRSDALNTLKDSMTELADTMGIEVPEFPIKHRDPDHLPTVQMEAMNDFLQQIIEHGVGDAKAPELRKKLKEVIDLAKSQDERIKELEAQVADLEAQVADAGQPANDATTGHEAPAQDPQVQEDGSEDAGEPSGEGSDDASEEQETVPVHEGGGERVAESEGPVEKAGKGVHQGPKP